MNTNHRSFTDINAKLQHHMDVVHEKFPELNIFYIALVGSQNYGYDTLESDVDSVCLVLPSKEDVILGKSRFSKQIDIDNEHCTIRDIRLMFDLFKKGNINALEILYTPFHIIPHTYMVEGCLLRQEGANAFYCNPKGVVDSSAGMFIQSYLTYLATTDGDKKKKLYKRMIFLTLFLRNYTDHKPIFKCFDQSDFFDHFAYNAETANNDIDVLRDEVYSVEYTDNENPKNKDYRRQALDDYILNLFEKRVLWGK